ncbi:hypothetical protein LSAT2_010737 [Lamellibrachia satsuma]|nr:hypothetical protein LSAT2_010737 [Lamellibrachia satsuma]
MKSGTVFAWGVLFLGLIPMISAYPHRPVFCYLPADCGWGYKCVDRWYYNCVTRSCEKFPYRGCGGNWNRFRSKNACYMKCIFGHSD